MILSEPMRAFAEKLPLGWDVIPFEALLSEPLRNGIYKSKEFHGSGTKIVNMGELFGSEYISDQDMRRIELTSEEKAKTTLRDGDLLFARRSLVLEGAGKCSLVMNPDEEVTFESSIIRARPAPERIAPRFLYYLFASPLGRAIMASIATRTAVSGIRGSDLAQVALPLPPLPVQRRIAGILSAYDDLIENSQRRIRILEEMARRLYREWFVHFRFPGHEDCRLVDSALGEIPEGWEIADLRDLSLGPKGIQTGPFGSQLHESDYSESGVPVIMPKDLIDFRIRSDGMSFIPEDIANELARHRMQPGDIVYGRRGDIGRRAFIMPHQQGWFCGTGCLRIRPDPALVDGFYLFNYLGQDDIVALIRGRAQGVTMPNLNTSLLESVPVRLPPRSIQAAFSDLSFTLAREREVIALKVDNLRRTRDLLLPRLLSGQIDVEALPEPTSAAQASSSN